MFAVCVGFALILLQMHVISYHLLTSVQRKHNAIEVEPHPDFLQGETQELNYDLHCCVRKDFDCLTKLIFLMFLFPAGETYL